MIAVCMQKSTDSQERDSAGSVIVVPRHIGNGQIRKQAERHECSTLDRGKSTGYGSPEGRIFFDEVLETVC
jgi:hypothetical protein